jgi:predicted RNA-binding Zn-ribbon protein involved in translation (DUF1610 family)
MIKADETTIGLKKTTVKKLKESSMKSETYDSKINSLLENDGTKHACPHCGKPISIKVILNADMSSSETITGDS